MHITRVYCGVKHVSAPLYDQRARKQTVSLTLNSDLYGQARAAGINVSRVAEEALSTALKARRAEALREEIRRDMDALARYVGEVGDPAAELRTMFEPDDAA